MGNFKVIILTDKGAIANLKMNVLSAILLIITYYRHIFKTSICYIGIIINIEYEITFLSFNMLLTFYSFN